MDHFELVSECKPTGDQPKAIADLVKGFKEGNQCQTLLGVTGSGKTDTTQNARCGRFFLLTAQQDVPCLLQTVSGYSLTGT